MFCQDGADPGRGVKKKGSFFSFLAGIEGRILCAGCIAVVLYVLFLAVLFFLVPKTFHVVLGMTATHVAFGRAAGMSLGYSLGLPNIHVIVINLVIETLVVILFYPLFVLSFKKLLVLKPLSAFMDKIRLGAEKHEKVVRKFGIAALAVFVFIPFWMTGPIVGSAIGFLLGFPWWLTLTAVLGGTYIAVVVWGVLLKGLFHSAAVYGPLAPIILLAVIILLSLISHLINKLHKK